MSKLHELLAAEKTVRNQADKCRQDLGNTFDKKRHLFGETLVTFKPTGEGDAVTEEQSDLQTTVAKELNWITDILSRAIDAAYQVDESNMSARADIKLDNGQTLATGVPATALLQLEKRISEIRSLVEKIPTLDPAKGFRIDSARGEDIYRARTDVRKRTAKVQDVLVLYPATDKHPAQTQLVTKDIVTGEIKKEEWSGLITPAQKADMMDRVEELSRAIKAARSRANDTEAASVKIGRKLLSYVFGLSATERV